MSEFVKASVSRFLKVRYSTSLKSFLNLLCIAFLDSFPNWVMNLFSPKGKLQGLYHRMTEHLTLRINGLRISVNDFAALQIMTDEKESFMNEYFVPKIGDVVVDVGAHIGKYTLLWAKKVGKAGHVVALEPKPENYRMLQHNIADNRLENISAFNAAAWNRAGSLTLFLGESSASASVHQYYSRNHISVPAFSLDELLKDYVRVDWLKVDVEGAEVEVLQGAADTLKRFKPKLMLEVWSFNYAKVLEILRVPGYKWVEVNPRIQYSDNWYTQIFAF